MFWPFGISSKLLQSDIPSDITAMSPLAWGLTMAAYKMELAIDIYLLDLIKCFCAAFIVRSSACTVNDIFDRRMDAGVGKSEWFSILHHILE